MKIKNFLSKVTKVETWGSVFTSLIRTLTGRGQSVLPVTFVEEKSEFGQIVTPDGSYLRYAKFYKTPIQHKGSVLVLMGRREFIEEYQEINQNFMSRDYQVFTFDWRGQGASKRFLDDQDKGHIDDYATYVKDLEFMLSTLIRQDIKPPFYIFAHSMGGHILLRYMLDHRPKDVAGLILSAPMVDIRTGTYPYRVARGIARAMMISGAAERYIFGENVDIINDEAFDGNPFTHDPERYFRRKALQRQYADYVVKGYTFGWLDATFRSIKHLTKRMSESKIDLPILLLSPEHDPVVKSDKFENVLGCFKNAKMHVYPDTGHCLLDERKEVRSQVWVDIDAFLNR